ncbi:MAG: hypothetical protein M3400_03470 [Actinomycetota bacterium]|nr:hypothetical protein [Actinomycetota bacterium]
MLVVGSDSDVCEEVLRVAATTGVSTQQIEAADLAEVPWAEAGLVVIDATAVDQINNLGLSRRPGVLIVTSSPPSVALWASAVSIGVEQVLELPAGQASLIERMSDVASGSGPLGAMVAVIGGCGGAGASTLAVALALSAARAGRRPVLLGTDPWDGGIDIVLGAEDVPGPRWPDLAEVSGRLPSAAIQEGLPYARGVRFLSSARRRPTAVGLAALSAVVTAARRTGEPVILDLPRCAGATARWLHEVLDLGVLVCPATVSGALASRALVTELQWNAGKSGIAVRRGLGRDITDDALTAAVGLPVLARIPEDPRLLTRQQYGEPPGMRPRSGLARTCAALWRLAVRTSAVAA